MPLIGFLGFSSPQAFASDLAAFHRGLGETGREGQTVRSNIAGRRGNSIGCRHLRRTGSSAIDTLAAIGRPLHDLAAKAATSTIPIVFVSGGDPVRMGLVDSLNRPGGNATGVYMLTAALEPKRLELMRELVPDAAVIGAIVDPGSPDTKLQKAELPAAASGLAGRSRFSTPAPMTRSTRPLPPWPNKKSGRSSSLPRHSTCRGATSLLLLRARTACPPFISFARSPRPAV